MCTVAVGSLPQRQGMISISKDHENRLLRQANWQQRPKGLDKENTVSINESRDTAERAYLIWEQAGRPDGKALEYWLQAEAELSTKANEQRPCPKEIMTATPKRGGARKREFQKTRSRR
jgi:hypothetical protein